MVCNNIIKSFFYKMNIFCVLVCPDFLDKCLMFIRLTNGSSWNQFKGQVCEMNGWSMVSIHSEVEQNLIGISLLRLFFQNFDEDVPTTQLAFIGKH